MKKKFLGGIIGIGLLVGAILGMYLVGNHTEKPNPQSENNNVSIKIVHVEEVAKVPDRYKGFLGVEGTVIEIDESQGVFLLGCADACIFMPVTYKGQMPELKSEIIVYGELSKQEDGRYIFEGTEVKAK